MKYFSSSSLVHHVMLNCVYVKCFNFLRTEICASSKRILAGWLDFLEGNVNVCNSFLVVIAETLYLLL